MLRRPWTRRVRVASFAGRAAVIVGLAGHIDHGKTTLVRALTGVNGDRLKEEKARGITIDLGFAYMSMAAGPPIGFIDVPGHERFVHTMLAGAAGIDYAILTIAADDGVKPQTLEHLAILDLLSVDRGVVVLTKADLASHERLGEVDREARAIIRGTTLANARVLTVSAMTGQGVDALRIHLEAASSVASDRSQGTRFRLAVDRVFTLRGVGLVATGTVYSGLVRVGDRDPDQSIRAQGAHSLLACAKQSGRNRAAWRSLRTQPYGSGGRKGGDSARRYGARSGPARADRPHRRDSAPLAQREEADQAVVSGASPPRRVGVKRAHRSAWRQARRPGRGGSRPTRARPADRGGRHGSLCDPRRIGAADPGRRRFPRSQGAGAQAAHGGKAGAARVTCDPRSGRVLRRAPGRAAVRRRPRCLCARPRSHGGANRRARVHSQPRRP